MPSSQSIFHKTPISGVNSSACWPTYKVKPQSINSLRIFCRPFYMLHYVGFNALKSMLYISTERKHRSYLVARVQFLKPV